jgi:hypothetical protein
MLQIVILPIVILPTAILPIAILPIVILPIAILPTHVALRTGSSTSHVKEEKLTHSRVTRVRKYCIK